MVRGKTFFKIYTMKNFTVGIACKNEENNIFSCLEHIESSLRHLNDRSNRSGHRTHKVIICLNNCNDRTEEEIERFKKQSTLQIKVTETGGNLVDAQRKIWELAKARPVVFIDADTHISKNTFYKLIKPFDDPNTAVSYIASSHSYINSNNLISKIHKLYVSGKYLTKQHYFHGRIFAISDWSVPPKETIVGKAQNSPSNYLLKYGGGLMTDDIVLSTYILDKYGKSSIRRIPDDAVYSNAVANWGDWFKTYRRISIEVHKINGWFPEWNHLKSTHYRRTDWSKWLESHNTDRWLWLIYAVIEKLWDFRISTELFLVRTGLINAGEQWMVTKSTKRKPIK